MVDVATNHIHHPKAVITAAKRAENAKFVTIFAPWCEKWKKANRFTQTYSSAKDYKENKI